MKQIVPATLIAAAFAFTPHALFAQDTDSAAAENSAAIDERLERQARQVESIREIDSLAVISLRQPSEASAGEAEGQGEDELASVSEEDLLLGGVGTRQMLTAEDTDELPPGMVEDDTVADTMAADEEMGNPATESDGRETDFSALHEAIEGNDVLAGALAERNVDIASVVGVEIRDGATVIVYIDES